MGAIAAVFDKQNEDATSLVSAMLEEMKHRGTRTPLIVGQPHAFITQFLSEMKTQKASSKVAVGASSAEPVIGEDYAWVLEGHFFPPPRSSFVHYIRDNLERHPMRVGRRILQKLSGAFVFAVLFPDKIMVGRDPIGTVPLYMGANKTVSAFASERKALWKIGITNTRSFQPGTLTMLNEREVVSEPVVVLRPPRLRKTNMRQAARQLQKLLERAVRERVSDARKVCVAFSGGLDSTVVASLAKLSGVSVYLICVGLAGQIELEQTKIAAELLNLPLTIQTYTVEDLEKVIPEVLWLIEEPSALKACIAIPFYWTAEIASKLGCRVLLAGQGADELFGGYRRYLTEYVRGGAEKAQQAMYNDVALSFETNFQRDEPVCAYHKVELRLPFADEKVIRYALDLPLSLKIKSADDTLRKRVLRQLARNIGLTAPIADRPKKAIQFTTGVDNALERLSKREGLTKRSYIEKVFRQVSGAWK